MLAVSDWVTVILDLPEKNTAKEDIRGSGSNRPVTHLLESAAF